MRRFGLSTAFIAVLLLATLAFTNVGTLGHRHDGLAEGDGHSHLPVYSAGHEHPHHTVHIEAASRIDSSPCVACLHRQRQNAATALDTSLENFTPSVSTISIQDDRQPAYGSYRIPAARAPPRA